MGYAEQIIKEAEKEINEEFRRVLIDKEKARLRAKAARPWWAKLFPWRITIQRKY